MKAAMYIRVSTEDQHRDGHSLDAQRAVLERYCGGRYPSALEVAEVFVDAGVSGSIPVKDRPAGAKLLEYVAAGHAQHIVAMKLDRMFRSALDCLETVDELKTQGVALHLLDLGFDTSSSQGRMFLTIVAAFAEFERNMARERTKATAAHLKATGKVYGTVPYGFDRNGDRLVPNETEQRTLKLIRKWRDRGDSYGGIAKELNARHTPAKGGGQWHAYSVQKVLGEAPNKGAKAK